MPLNDETLYNDQHWEILIETIIERIGVERFLDMTAYVLEGRQDRTPGMGSIVGEIERLAVIAQGL